MICNSCKGEFDNINGLKFCPYCGTKLEDDAASEVEKLNGANEEVAATKAMGDTLEMPIVTKEQIRNYKMQQYLEAARKPFKNFRVIITMITVILFVAAFGIGYVFFSGRPVSEAAIKDDLIGKTIMLPKGTSFEIKKGYIKNLSISERNTNKSEKKDDIKASVTLNNGSIEVKTLLSIEYFYGENRQWKISDNISLAGNTSVKPLVGMEDQQIIDRIKKLSIKIGDTSKALNDADVKTLNIASRTPDFDNLKETALIDLGIDNGLISTSGKMKCTLSFENEAWTVTSVERNSTEDFALQLSPAFSQDKLVELIKKEPLEKSVSSPNVFGGKSFYINDSFTKSFDLGDKKFDQQSKNLTVTVKRENTAGEVKTVLSTDYTFTLSYDKIQLLKKSKTTVDSVSINDVSQDTIVSSLVNSEIEGSSIFLWFSENHKITTDEAKTFKISKESSQKGLENVKYVFGTITYNDGNKQKNTAVVSVYLLVYDNTKGYSWKLDRVVGEDSPNYKMYINQ